MVELCMGDSFRADFCYSVYYSLSDSNLLTIVNSQVESSVCVCVCVCVSECIYMCVCVCLSVC